MASMGPPMVPAFSLRVQLFAPTANGSSDKPIRNFRVIIKPEATVREFCERASSEHEINYGEPISIKRCQDDQGFDIKQSEIIGSLFVSTAIIRVIQASTVSGVRGSVPPTSVLRFDNANIISRKRDREISPKIYVNGGAPSSAWNSNKRQRVSELDPDHPLPSREGENRRGNTANIIPNSQESVMLGANAPKFSTTRQVRHISETPSPEPEEFSTDHQCQQYTNDRSTLLEIRESSPVREAAVMDTQALNHQGRKSASFHVAGLDRGTSVSTATTSPLSVDQRNATLNGITKRKPSESFPGSRKSSGNTNLSMNEDSVYNIPSDEEDRGAAIMEAKKAKLKTRNSPKTGLRGLEWTNNGVNTPPNGRQSREWVTPGELPLTPNSRERRQKELQTEESSSNARRAQLAAAEAAQQRRREADEARLTEEANLSEQQRAQREEQERIEVEEFKRGEAEAAARTKAERLQKQRDEVARRAEEERVAEEKVNQAKADSGRLAQEKREVAEAKRLHDENAEEEVEKLRKMKEDELQKRIPSSPPEQLNEARHPSPILPRATPSRALSSTGFFPPRKPALKSQSAVQSSPSASSNASPEASLKGVGIEAQMPLPRSANRRVSFAETTTSFDETPLPVVQTPIRPPARISSRRAVTPQVCIPKNTPIPAPPATKIPTPMPLPKNKTSSVPAPAATKILTPMPPPTTKAATLQPLRKSTRPILPPSSTRFSKDRSTTPQVHLAVPQNQNTKKPSPPASEPRKISQVTPSKGKSPVQSSLAKAEPNPIESESEGSDAVESPSDESGSDSDEEDEDQSGSESNDEQEQEQRVTKASPPKAVIPTKSPSPGKETVEAAVETQVDDSSSKGEQDTSVKGTPKPMQFPQPNETADSDDEDDAETTSRHSSDRDSRSPVVFSHHEAQTQDASRTHQSAYPNQGSDEESASDEDVEMPDAKKGEFQVEMESSSSESDDEEQVQVPESSPPQLPPHKSAPSHSKLKDNFPKETPKQSTSKTQSIDSDPSTQEEIDNQLTSSMYEVRTSVPATSTPIPPPNSSRPNRESKFGRSLDRLNEPRSKDKITFPSSAPALNRIVSGRSQGQKKIDEDEEQESDEESDSNDSDSSNDDVSARNKKNKMLKGSKGDKYITGYSFSQPA